MPKPTIEFTPVATFAQHPLLGPGGKPSADGTLTRVLAKDEQTGDCTQILYHPPGARWGSSTGVTHTYWEEVLILSGRLRDTSLGRWFGEQNFCCRPPGMVHGPFEADPAAGCVEIVWTRFSVGGRQMANRVPGRLELMSEPHIVT